jgi:hypothetical protein
MKMLYYKITMKARSIFSFTLKLGRYSLITFTEGMLAQRQ